MSVRDRPASPLAGAERGGTHREADSLNKLFSWTACFPSFAVSDPDKRCLKDSQILLPEAKVRKIAAFFNHWVV